MATKLDNTYQALRDWGCPVHYENLTAFMHGYSMSDDEAYWLTPTFRQLAENTRRTLATLANKKRIRWIRPGVYSAWSAERD